MAFYPSSYIKTGAGVDSRTVDRLTFPITFRPQALTLYLRFAEMGSRGIQSARYLQIGGASGARLIVRSNSAAPDGGTIDVVYVSDTGASVQSTPSVSPSIGATVEVLGTITTNGAVTCSVSINGGTLTVGTTSANLLLSPTWGTNVLALNFQSGAAQDGLCAFRDVRITAGVKTMQEMRRLAGTD